MEPNRYVLLGGSHQYTSIQCKCTNAGMLELFTSGGELKLLLAPIYFNFDLYDQSAPGLLMVTIMKMILNIQYNVFAFLCMACGVALLFKVVVL